MALWSQAVDTHDLPAWANIAGLRLATTSHIHNVPATVDLHAESADFKPHLPQQQSRAPALLSHHAVQRNTSIAVRLSLCAGRCLAVAKA